MCALRRRRWRTPLPPFINPNHPPTRPSPQELEASAAASTSSQQTQHAPAAPAGGAKQLQRQYADTYQRLVEYGFTPAQVQSALTALPLGAAAGVEAPLDWLCLNLPQGQLPRRFAGAARGGGGGAGGGVAVKVLAARVEGAGAGGGQQQQDDEGPPGQPEGDDEESEEAESAREEGSEDGGDEAAGAGGEDEKAAAKAWILQQYGGGSSDGEDGGSGPDDAASEDSVIEDWELWGDPREIEVGWILRGAVDWMGGGEECCGWERSDACRSVIA